MYCKTLMKQIEAHKNEKCVEFQIEGEEGNFKFWQQENSLYLFHLIFLPPTKIPS
jgi:hypothetical protein